MQDWSKSLSSFLTGIWAELGDFTHPRCGYAGLAGLATQTDNGPELRQLVIRAADRASGLLTLHTDNTTAKCEEIRSNGNVSLLVWRPENDLQIRIKARAEVLGSFAARKVWSELPFASRGNYGVNPRPGTPIGSAFDYERSADQARLAVISLHVREIDAVRLADPKHYRARFVEADNWAGTWLAP